MFRRTRHDDGVGSFRLERYTRPWPQIRRRNGEGSDGGRGLAATAKKFLEGGRRATPKTRTVCRSVKITGCDLFSGGTADLFDDSHSQL